MACIDSIVTLGICPDEEQSTSGLSLLLAPGISIKNLNNIATETYSQGVRLAMEKKKLAISLVRTDFIGALQANRVIATVARQEISSGTFKTNVALAATATQRGLTLHKTVQNGSLRQTKIKEIHVYPLTSGTGELKIVDASGSALTWSVSFVAGQVNVFDVDSLGGFPYVLPDNSDVRVLINAPNVSFAQSSLTCLKGCNNTMPNKCGWVDGWDGTGAVKEDGFGVNIVFYCECDYDRILCDLSSSFIGQLIWLRWQIAIFEEQLASNRFNNWVIFDRDRLAQETIPNLFTTYNEKWQAMMNGLLGILRQYRDECLDCRGTKWVTSI